MSTTRPLLADDLVRVAAIQFDCSAGDILSGSRMRHVCYARMACAWAIRHKFAERPLSYPSIARVMKMRHSSVIYSVHRAEQIRAVDHLFQAETDRLLRLARGTA